MGVGKCVFFQRKTSHISPFQMR